jgi:hypothetical protein
MSNTSNIRIVSNIYPVKTVTELVLRNMPPRKVGVTDDQAFRLRIRCRKALVTLANLKHGGAIDDRQQARILLENRLVSQAQIDAYFWDNGRCVDCLPGERPFGIVSNGESFRVECRCQKRNCPAKIATPR